MLQTRLTLERVHSRNLEVEFLYGGLELYRITAESRGIGSVRDLIRQIRRARVTHPCERALQVLVDLVETVLDGQATWDEARQYLDRLAWQQNSN